MALPIATEVNRRFRVHSQANNIADLIAIRNPAVILKHVQSNSGDLFVCDLKTKPLTLDQINYLRAQPQYTGRGPIIISEYNNQPWYPNEFRRWWRKVADAAGVPKSIRNSDSRDRRKVE